MKHIEIPVREESSMIVGPLGDIGLFFDDREANEAAIAINHFDRMMGLIMRVRAVSPSTRLVEEACAILADIEAAEKEAGL